MWSVEDLSHLANWSTWLPSHLFEDPSQVAVEHLPRVLEVPFRVLPGLRDSGECFVQQGDDSVLFGEGWERNRQLSQG